MSLLTAVALWVAVAREPELATSLSVPVEFKNMPDDLDFTSNVPDRVHLEVRGQSGRLSRDNLAESGRDAGFVRRALRRSIPTLSTRLQCQSAVRGHLLSRDSSQVTLSFGRLVARDVPIQPNYVKIPDGYQDLRAKSSTRTKSRIRGPEERVKSIEACRYRSGRPERRRQREEFRTHVNVGDPQVRHRIPQRYHREGDARAHPAEGNQIVARTLFGTDGIRGVAGNYPLDQQDRPCRGRRARQMDSPIAHAAARRDRNGHARIRAVACGGSRRRAGTSQSRSGFRGSHHHARRRLSR